MKNITDTDSSGRPRLRTAAVADGDDKSAPIWLLDTEEDKEDNHPISGLPMDQKGTA